VLDGNDIRDDVHDDRWESIIVDQASDQLLHGCYFLVYGSGRDFSFYLLEIWWVVISFYEEGAETHD